jgi:hypothetical protein
VHDICNISTFSNFQMFGWIKSKLFTCLIRGFSFYCIKQIDKILPLSVQLLIFIGFGNLLWQFGNI